MGLKLLLTEDQSPLGKSIARALDDYPYTLLCPPTDHLNWRDSAAVKQYLTEHRPTVVLNTLAVAAGEDPAALDVVPHEGLAATCGERVAAIHLSSYRVFGTADCVGGAYDEADVPTPNDALGQQLQQAEAAFLALPKGLVLRLPWLLDAHTDTILTRVASRLVSGERVEVSDIHRGSPTTVDDVARVVLAMLLQILCGAENWGAFHLHTSDSCSEAEFADHVARLLDKEGCRNGGIDILRNPNDHLMPGCGLLTGLRCTNNFGVQLRSWRHGLKGALQACLADQLAEGKKAP